ncbi:MAG: ABC-F family ATP-binding cassette domain-containing protein [Clostridia bacterium]|nr:ABC-F family ATP-binding cassette domain-containing protein [Clostridia bacterium]
MLYQVKNGAVELGANTVLKRIDFEIRDNEKIAIVGRNGCGKTTLLKLIYGEYDLKKNGEDTTLVKSGKLSLGYLSQGAFSSLDKTVDEEISQVFSHIISKKARMDELLEKMQASQDLALINEYNRLQDDLNKNGGYFYEKEYNLLFQKFGFTKEDKARPLSTFSGGQLTKLAFIKLLLSQPDVLLLDEPTNHLDIETLEWLESYLKSYKRAIVFVSHDRMFVDKIADVVYEIEHGITKRYVGNYTSFVKQKEENYERELKAYKRQQEEIKRLEALIDKFRDTPTKVSMTDSKMKQIEHMEKLEEPKRFDTRTFKATFKPNRDTGKEVLTVTNLEFGYDKALARVSFKQYKGDRIGIIGGNGLGKSTLLKTIVGQIPKISGEITRGYQVDIGYFDQQMMQIKSSKTVLDEFWDAYPKLSETEARNTLGAFMFTGDDVFKSVSMLSGGELVRLALAKILQEKPNFLILDEPTNHMDMIGKETLESMLSQFEGTILFVSHDRYFVKKLASSLIAFDGKGATHLPFTYEEYLRRRENETTTLTVTEKKETPISSNKESYLKSKERGKMERRLAKVYSLIEETEGKIEEKTKEESLEENQSDYERLLSISKEIEELEVELLTLMEECESLENALK